jgi:hypothetical protein
VSSESAGGDGTVQNDGRRDGPADELGEIGPVDVVLIEFPPGAPMTGEAVDHARPRQAADRPRGRPLHQEGDGRLFGLAARDLRPSVGDFEAFEGANRPARRRRCGDRRRRAEPGASAVLIVYENSWAGPFAAAIRRSGGRLIASERVSVRDLIEAIEATEAGTPQSGERVDPAVTRSALGRTARRVTADRRPPVRRWAAQHNGTNGHAAAGPDRLD